nr:omega-6 fatty acid desaturase, chloroplastic [Ipomoea batatas]
MACSVADSSFLILTPSKRPILGNKIAQLSFPGITSEGLNKIRTKHSRCSISFRKTNVIRAVAVPVAPSPAESAEDRKLLCERYGFRQIGEPLPDNVTLKDIIDTLPKKVFEIDNFKAWKTVLISVTSYSLGLYMIAKAPWYLLPLAWAWTGTAITGFFVIGHDCAHKSFSKNKLVEDIVGTLAMMPLIYPYEPWRFKHDRHHAKTNMVGRRHGLAPCLERGV